MSERKRHVCVTKFPQLTNVSNRTDFKETYIYERNVLDPVSDFQTA